jgi:hypothetical protein
VPPPCWARALAIKMVAYIAVANRVAFAHRSLIVPMLESCSREAAAPLGPDRTSSRYFFILSIWCPRLARNLSILAISFSARK